jgi:TonB family protein
MDDSFVYRKSGLGAAQLAATHNGALSRSERLVLIMLDGRRTIAELSDVFGADTIRRVVPQLLTKGFAKRVDPDFAAGWENAITQLHVGGPVVRVPKPAACPRSDGHPMAWIALATVLTIVGSYWATDHYRSRINATWQFSRALAQVGPTDAYGVPTSTDAYGANGPDFPAPETITPISRLSTGTPSGLAAAISPARVAPPPVAPPPVARDHPAVVRSQPPVAPAVHPIALPARKTPTADSATALAVKLEPVDTPVARALPSQVATADETPAAPSELPIATPIDAPAPVVAAEAPPATPPDQIAMAAPTEPPSLRPLRRDPPRFPERALRNGISQSHVQARLWVTPEGKVDQVDILEATPPGIFDDEVRRALSLWTFEPPGHPAEQVVDLALKP